jgi:DnaJ family protein C protein 2
LADAGKRKKYDSSLPFDDKIPAKDISEADFYEEYSKCFTLNSKFAVHRPVPTLGDADTPMEEVRKFYKYWDSFKTWREFAQYDEYDVEDA